jgi:hypothetical protein
MVPDEFRTLFWDTDPAGFDPVAYPDYTIFRVLEYGDTGAFEWLRTLFADDEIVRVLRSERRLTPKSANFWALVYRVPVEDVAALQADRPAVLNHA